MRALHRLLLVGIVVILAVTLAGCVRVNRALVLNSDGSGVYTLTIGFREPRQGDPTSLPPEISTAMEAFAAHVQQQGGTFLRYADQGYAYWTFIRSFSVIAQANALLQEDPRQYDSNHTPVLYRDLLHIAREARLSATTYRVTGSISLSDPLGTSASWRDATESLAITMPNGVSAHLGGTLSGNTVTYTIGYNQSAEIDVSGNATAGTGVGTSVFTALRFAAVGALLVLAVGLASLGGWLLRSPRKRER